MKLAEYDNGIRNNSFVAESHGKYDSGFEIEFPIHYCLILTLSFESTP
uniref:Uncharacterized protein n=1 Tax=Candidatus Kentrum sp. TC TaxID=2126339 RepID=A0A451A7H1_9GAMM|nr:MAG: hypothetical protein BECKTC1821F_GA0114240_10668 [Candidatus Kentron sp. TC]